MKSYQFFTNISMVLLEPFRDSARTKWLLISFLAVGALLGATGNAESVVNTYYVQNSSCGSNYTNTTTYQAALTGGSNCGANDYAARDRSSGDMIVAYTPVFAIDTTITGQVGSNINFKDQDDGSYTGRARLVEVNNAGNAILNSFGEVTVSGTRNSWRYITDLSTLSGTINAGNRLGLVVGASAGSANVWSFFSQTEGGANNEIWFVVDEVSVANAVPTITSNASTAATEDVQYTYDPIVSDPDGPGTTWTILGTDTCPGSSINSSTGAYAFTPTGPTPISNCTLAIQVCDGGSPNECASETLTVNVTAVDDPSTLSISQPSGQTVTVGNPFNITYSFSDPEGAATVSLYYDTDNADFNGTGITGCSNQVAGTNQTCSWDTNGPGVGTYYVYGVPSDTGSSVYSAGSLTIDPAPVNDMNALSATALAASTTSISVTMPYVGDNDNDGFFDVEYQACGGSYSPWTTGGVTASSPFAATITGLTDGACYDVRMTYNDPDGVNGTAQQVVSNIYLPTNRTTPGTAAGIGTSDSVLRITAPYTNDQNGDNTLKIEYKLVASPTYTTWAPDPQPHSNSPYLVNINGLSESTSYDIRVTYNDTDGFSGGQPQVQIFQTSTTAAYTANPMLHNSDNLGTKYWSGSGGWGVPGGQYGVFNCNTCHLRKSGNIKRVSNSILGNPVAFDKTSGAGNSFGDDSDSRGAAGSTRPCEVCHTQTNFHRRTANATPDLTHYNQADCIECHEHKQGFKPIGACDVCHDVNASNTSAPKVVDVSGGTLNGQAFGSHLKVLPGDDLSGVTWEDQCKQCHQMHSGAVFIANNPAVGINYTSHGGIYLGGASTNAMINTKTTEAEICWGCHDNNGGTTSEWNAMSISGFTTTGGSNWTTATFDIIGNAVPNRNTLSVHTANDIDTDSGGDVRNSSVANNVDWTTNVGELLVGSESLENISAIRCSYCHDVHGTANYTGVIADADDPDGAPYLRGNWLTNPYPIERPPETGDTYTGNVYPATGGVSFPSGFNVPRLFADSAGSASIGGFFIDQNSGYPTRKGDNTYMSVDEVGGLCTLCHGSDVDNMDYYAGSNLWQGTNGHSNSTVSGTGGNAVDLFDARRGDNTYNMHMQGLPDTAGNDRRWGNGRDTSMPFGGNFVGSRPDRANNNYLPPRNTGWYGGTPGDPERNSLTEYSKWYNGAGGAGAIGSNGDGFTTRAHSFSCSKCHTPHASGLPALLITNCLDPAVATWSNNQGSTTVGPGVWGGANTRNRFNAMGNCHRNEGTGSGWNKLAEGQ